MGWRTARKTKASKDASVGGLFLVVSQRNGPSRGELRPLGICHRPLVCQIGQGLARPDNSTAQKPFHSGWLKSAVVPRQSDWYGSVTLPERHSRQLTPAFSPSGTPFRTGFFIPNTITYSLLPFKRLPMVVKI